MKLIVKILDVDEGVYFPDRLESIPIVPRIGEDLMVSSLGDACEVIAVFHELLIGEVDDVEYQEITLSVRRP